MAKKSHIDKAIESLQARQAGISAKAKGEIDAIESAILALRQQQRARKPRVVAAQERPTLASA